MVVWGALAAGIGEQEIRDPWGRGFLRYLYHDLYDSSVYARWLECRCRWLPRHARECGRPDEGPGALRRILLFAETGCRAGGS